MNRKAFIVVLLVLVLFSLNFSVAHEMDNSTNHDLISQEDSNLLSVSDNNPTVLKESELKTQIDVESNTNFDVVGDYFKIKLSDENGNALNNTKVTFTLLKNTYTKTTNGNGVASLQLNLNDGSYNITTKFAGNSNYKSSSLITQITMDNTRVVDAGLSNSEIQKIIDDAKDKNIILFKGKSYSDINLVINKRLTLLSNVNTVLKSSSSNPTISIKGQNASNTIINGFNIQGKGNGIVVTNSDFVRIINNDITTSGNGIVATGTTYLNITKNDINKNSKSGIVIADTTSTYIFNNNINGNGVNAIEIAKSNKLYIHGNTIRSNNKNGIVLTTTVNGINYKEGPKNVYINKNTISKNLGDGILISTAGDNVNIKSNNIEENHGNGISISHIGSNSIQSNVIYDNWDNGIKFFDNYVKPNNQEISYNAIYYNHHMDVEAKDTYYQDTGTRLQLGDNWYTDFAGICPKIKSNNLKFTVTQIGDNKFQATFTDSNGNIASLLPDRTLKYTINGGQTVSITISGGAGVFTVDANDGDIIKATVDNSRRDNTYDSNSKTSQPINGVTPSYEYPLIPYENENMGNGDGNGNGNGNGDGSGNGGSSNQGSSNNNGNSTHSQNSDPSNSGTNQVSDASQNYETQDAASQGASAGSRGYAGDAGSKSVVKQIIFDEDDIFRVTGISLIVLLIILTIGFYYRDDIREMNSKR